MIRYESYSDEQLLELMRRDDAAGFTALYERYWKSLLVRACYLLGSSQDAEDLVHDVFVNIWKRRHELVLRHTFKTYLSAIFRYECLHKLASRKLHPLLTPLPEVQDATTERFLDFKQLQETLSKAVDELPSKCRLIFQMSRQEGLSDKQIADQLHISVATVRTQKHRALTKLRLSLGRIIPLNIFFL